MVEKPPTPADRVIAQRARAADLHSRLMIQQQWTATMFTITALRADEGGIDLIPGLGKLRDTGTDAVREFARLGTLLQWVDAEYLADEAIEALWKVPLFHLTRLVNTLEELRSPVRTELWDAQARGGQRPTHPVVDVDSMRVSRV